MKKNLLTLLLLSASICTTFACSASTSKASNQEAAVEKTDKQEAPASPVQHIDAAFMRQHIWDYKAEPSKFVFKGQRPAIIDFYADWCGPCRKLSPKLEAAAKKYAGKIDVYKINVDQEPELAQIFGVRSIPMVLFVPMQGTPIQTVGDLTPAEIEQSISEIYKAK